MLADVLRDLYARVPMGMRLGLEAMRAACREEGDPQDSFPSVHIGGTNGKGSTCAMVESIARAAGLRTGLYTSPHLCRFAERIRLGGEPIDDATLERHLRRALRHDLSFFEAATLAAFLAFREAQVDLAVIEVGIGGRLDATNVLARPRVAAITTVALDHQDRLGDTIAQIAREKSGIAKPGVPLLVGDLPAEARAVIEAPIVESAPLPDLELRMLGAYQRENASLASRIGLALGFPERVVRDGIESATWPGRFERIGRFLLDGAHNPAGMRALVDSTLAPGAVIFGSLEDKQWREMLAILGELHAPRFYVAPKGRAAAAPETLAAFLPGTPCASFDEARDRAAHLPDTILVCGSLYLVGEARAKLLNLPVDPPVAL